MSDLDLNRLCNISIELPENLEQRRDEFTAYIKRGHEIVADFCAEHGWLEHMQESYMDSACFHDSKNSYDDELVRLFKVEKQSIPATFSAMLEFRKLQAVSPEIYLKNYPHGSEPEFYEKLVAHEIAHRLHIRILLGDEEAMGPIWFFEGFATNACNQFSNIDHTITSEEIREITMSEKRGDYRKYHKIVKYLSSRIPMPELVHKVRDKDFRFLDKVLNS